MGYRQVRVFSGKGSGPDQFAEALNGIAVDRTGLIYAVGGLQVKVFDDQGGLLRRWDTQRPAYCVAINADGVVFVGEAGQVERFDQSGKLLATWREADRLGAVTAIGFHGEYVLVADARDRCIRRYSSGGEWLNNIGKDNNTKGFLIPNGYLDFSVDDRGIIHAPNPAKHRVERYSLAGELLGHFGKFGTRQPQDFPGCCNPTNLALTAEGHIVVTEKAGPRMKVYDANGTMLALVGPEAFDANCKNMDVAVDSRGRVYVIDTERLNIHVFAPDAVSSEPPGASGPSSTEGVVKP